MLIREVIGSFDTVEIRFSAVATDGNSDYAMADFELVDGPGITLQGQPVDTLDNDVQTINLRFSNIDLEQEARFVLPSWFEGIRGPNGEWLAGTVDVVNSKVGPTINNDPFNPVQVVGNDVLVKWVTNSGSPADIVCPCIPSITVNGNVPVIATVEPDGRTLRLTYASPPGSGDTIFCPNGVSCLRGVQGGIPIGFTVVIP